MSNKHRKRFLVLYVSRELQVGYRYAISLFASVKKNLCQCANMHIIMAVEAGVGKEELMTRMRYLENLCVNLTVRPYIQMRS